MPCDPGLKPPLSGVFGRLIGHQVDVFPVWCRRRIQRARSYSRPASCAARDPTTRPKCCPDETATGTRVWARPARCRVPALAGVSSAAGERQYRASDIGKRHHLAADGETTVIIRLCAMNFAREQFRSGDQAIHRWIQGQLLFPRQQCLAVVQLCTIPRPSRFEWVHHLKTHARHQPRISKRLKT